MNVVQLSLSVEFDTSRYCTGFLEIINQLAKESSQWILFGLKQVFLRKDDPSISQSHQARSPL